MRLSRRRSPRGARSTMLMLGCLSGLVAGIGFVTLPDQPDAPEFPSVIYISEQLFRSAAPRLRAVNSEVVHAQEIGLATQSDAEIIQYARNNQWTVVTVDADFHALLALSGGDRPSVLRIRCEGLSGRPRPCSLGDAGARRSRKTRNSVSRRINRRGDGESR